LAAGSIGMAVSRLCDKNGKFDIEKFNSVVQSEIAASAQLASARFFCFLEH
jgi:hypothetical protein